MHIAFMPIALVSHALVSHVLVSHVLVSHLLVSHLLVSHVLVSHVLVSHVPVSHVLLAATGLPSIDVQKNCRESSNALYGSATSDDAMSSCVEDEKAAAATLGKDWSSFPAADKARCVHMTYLPSYVEWLTCIEQEDALRRIRKDNSTGTPGG